MNLSLHHTEHVTSLDTPALQAYRTLRRPHDHIKQGIFIAEGEKVVRRLLVSNLPVISLLMTSEWFQQCTSPGYPSIPKGAKIFLAEKDLLETIVGYNLHQGIMALGKIPNEESITEVLDKTKKPFLLVALDGLVNAENVGVIIRNCAAFGVDAVISGERSSSPYLRRAVRNSMGTVFTLPVIHSTNLISDLTLLRTKHAANIIAAHAHDHSLIHDCSFSGNVCIVLGNEGEGISNDILSVCTERVTIPMANNTDSLNVANASAVFLYEADKQRKTKRK